MKRVGLAYETPGRRNQYSVGGSTGRYPLRLPSSTLGFWNPAHAETMLNMAGQPVVHAEELGQLTDLSGNGNHFKNAVPGTSHLCNLTGVGTINGVPATYSSLNLSMDLDVALTNVRFLAGVYRSDNVATYAPVIGHPTLYDFAGNNNGMMFSTYTNDYVKNGVVRVNGVARPSLYALKPYCGQVVTVQTTGNVAAQRWCCDRATSNNYGWVGPLGCLLLCSSVPSADEILSIERWMAGQYKIVGQLVLDGDSHTDFGDWFTQFKVEIPQAALWTNYKTATNGYTMYQCQQFFSAGTGNRIIQGTTQVTRNSVVFCGAGTNDLAAGYGATTTLNNTIAYLDLCDAFGATAVVWTPMPRTTQFDDAGYETERQIYSTSMRNLIAQRSNHILVDLAADPVFGPPGAQNNAAEFMSEYGGTTKVHLINGSPGHGYDRLGTLIANATRHLFV